MYFLAETEITNTKIWSAVEPENVLLLYSPVIVRPSRSSCKPFLHLLYRSPEFRYIGWSAEGHGRLQGTLPYFVEENASQNIISEMEAIGYL